MTAEAHHAAVVARLKADTQLTSAVFEVGEVPVESPPSRYIVVESTLGRRSQTRFTSGRGTLTTTHYLHCVGLTAAQARWLSGRVEAQLLDYTLTMTGRVVRKPADWVSRPVTVDLSGPVKKPFGVTVFDLTSEPA